MENSASEKSGLISSKAASGHARRFELTLATSALHPIATKFRHRGNDVQGQEETLTRRSIDDIAGDTAHEERPPHGGPSETESGVLISDHREPKN
jgi:hypothetical protein